MGEGAGSERCTVLDMSVVYGARWYGINSISPGAQLSRLEIRNWHYRSVSLPPGLTAAPPSAAGLTARSDRATANSGPPASSCPGCGRRRSRADG